MNRWRYAALAVGTIGVGLAVNAGRASLPAAVADVSGDALWAAMIFWWVGALVPGAGRSERALGAYGISALVEVSQLIRTPWLDRIRSTAVGHLVLGSDFDWRDIAAYALGVGLAMAADRLLRGPEPGPPPTTA